MHDTQRFFRRRRKWSPLRGPRRSLRWGWRPIPASAWSPYRRRWLRNHRLHPETDGHTQDTEESSQRRGQRQHEDSSVSTTTSYIIFPEPLPEVKEFKVIFKPIGHQKFLTTRTEERRGVPLVYQTSRETGTSLWDWELISPFHKSKTFKVPPFPNSLSSHTHVYDCQTYNVIDKVVYLEPGLVR